MDYCVVLLEIRYKRGRRGQNIISTNQNTCNRIIANQMPERFYYTNFKIRICRRKKNKTVRGGRRKMEEESKSENTTGEVKRFEVKKWNAVALWSWGTFSLLSRRVLTVG